MGERSVNFSIRWLPDQSIRGDVDTPINKKKSMVIGTGHVYFKSHTSIFTYLLIDQLIDKSDGRKRWRDRSVEHQTQGRIALLVYQHRDGYSYRWTQINGWQVRALSISNQRHQYAPMNTSINKLIYQRTDKMDEGEHQQDSRHQEALTDWSINRDMDTPINRHKLTDGPCLFKIPDINIHPFIDR